MFIQPIRPWMKYVFFLVIATHGVLLPLRRLIVESGIAMIRNAISYRY